MYVSLYIDLYIYLRIYTFLYVYVCLRSSLSLAVRKGQELELVVAGLAGGRPQTLQGYLQGYLAHKEQPPPRTLQ